MLIDDVYSGGTQEDGDYMLLSQAMELGLYHPNCRHGSDTYYREREEFFEKYYKSHPELDNPLSETAADDYGEHNEAHIDNMIQRYRRLVTGSVDETNIANHQILLDKWLDKKSAVVDKSVKNDIIGLGSDEVVISSIDKPIEQRNTGKGNPNAILIFDVGLNKRQERLLEMLPDFDSKTVVSKNSVNMADLAALTAKTGVEYAMFTKGSERLIIRGNEYMVNIDVKIAQKLVKDGYKWSGHTHPGNDMFVLFASDGDKQILKCFNQEQSVILNSKGHYNVFGKE